MSALLLLRAVATACLLAVPDALCVQGAADDLVAHARQVTYTPAAHQHDGVLLEVVTDARDIGSYLYMTGEPDSCHLAQRRVRLLGRGRIDARADPAALRAALERRSLVLGYLVLPPLADQLLDRGQRVSVFLCRAPLGATPSVFFVSGGRVVSTTLDVPDLLVYLPARPPRSGVSQCSRRTQARKRARNPEGKSRCPPCPR